VIFANIITLPRKKEDVFEINCDFAANYIPANMPSRNWDKRTKRWRAPIVRLNVEYLRRMREAITGSDEFWNVLNFYKTKKPSRGYFPEKNYPFKTTPFPHQLEGVKKLYPLERGALFADIGTGKTKMAIDIAACRYYGGEISKVLVIALVSIKDNWDREINIHSPIPTSNHVLQTTKAGQKRYKRFLEEDGFRWLITGVESFSAGKAFDLCQEYIDDETMIIIDESDSIKTDGAIRTERCIQMGKLVKYSLIMTGTPITQGVIDLYSQFEFLDSDVIGIGSFYGFRNRFAVMGGHDNKQIIGYQRMDELMECVSPYIYQVRKRDVLTDLPPATYQERKVKMSAEQKKMYKDLKSELRMIHNGRVLTVKSVINLMQRFSEITGGFYSYIDTEVADMVPIDENAKIKYKKAYLKSNPKLKELMYLISTMNEDEPIIVWAVSKMETACITAELRSVYGDDAVVEMHGGVSREQRTKNLDKFQAGEARFLTGNQGVGGIGLNMTVSATMIYFSNNFSLKMRIQSEGRIERIGQTRAMTYIDLVCEGSIDKYVLKALKNKLDFAEVIRHAFDSGELETLV